MSFGGCTELMAEADEPSGFECNICLLLAQDPVITQCGHLYCWPCIYRELKKCHANCLECPVCKAEIHEETLVPLYGRGKTPTDPTPKLVEGIQIPKRPVVWRPAQFTTYTPLTKTSSTQMKTRRDIKL